MTTCKVIVNKDSGNCDKLNLPAVLDLFRGKNVVIEEIDGNCDWNASDVDEVVVCGGDGTLYNALNKCADKQLYYVPCGTLNEASVLGDTIDTVGCVDNKVFGYVCATGSFTEIGYDTKCSKKRRLKCLAYLLQVFKWYTSRNVKAVVDVDGKDMSGRYTLLMAIKSKTCFGFRFNKMYDKKPQLYLLGIRSCGDDCLLTRAAMFFPFFRVFFCGVRRPTENKRWFMLPVNHVKITFDEVQDWCVDGEKFTSDKVVELSCRACKQVKVLKF